MTHSSPSTPIHPAAEPFRLPGSAVGILIIHGYGGSIGDYRQYAQQLNHVGYTVAGMRLAGHGQGLDALRRTSVDDMQQSVIAAVQDLRSQVSSVVVVGSSFGATLALDYAEQHSQELAAVVVVNAALTYRGGGVFQGLLLRLLRLTTPYYTKRGMTPEDIRRGEEVGSSTAWPINGILETKAFAQRQVIPKLGTIRAPTLILHSSADPVVGTEHNVLLLNSLGSRIKVEEILPIATHRPFRDPTAITALTTATTKFLDRCLANHP